MRRGAPLRLRLTWTLCCCVRHGLAAGSVAGSGGVACTAPTKRQDGRDPLPSLVSSVEVFIPRLARVD